MLSFMRSISSSENSIPLYNVSEITFLIKSQLEEQFRFIRIKGEIGTFRKAASGHCYFVLKDRDSLINAVIFRFQMENLDFIPRDGQSVIVLGRISVYPQRGNYQIICETIEQVGQGDILLMLEERKKRLAEEGLFDPSGKKPLPPYPRRIGVITSAGGAALQDIIRVLKRRMNGFTLYVYDSLVQGEKAPASLIEGIRYFQDFPVDVLLLSRGGGSMEDLLAFSDEGLVRAVADSTVPVITGVGHEIDFTLVDFAGNYRAATPSAAAEILSQSAVTIRSEVRSLKESLIRSVEHRVDIRILQYNENGKERLIGNYRDYLDALKLKMDSLNTDISRNTESAIRNYRHRVELNRMGIINQSPESILEKGFSLVIRDDQIISSAQDLYPGDPVELKLQDGSRKATIEEE